MIADILKFRRDIDEKYIYEIRNNIVKVYEKGIVNKTLNEIENLETEKITKKQLEQDDLFASNIKKLRKSLGLSNQSLTKSGYASIICISNIN